MLCGMLLSRTLAISSSVSSNGPFMKAKKGDIVHKLKIARGQLDGILQMVEENRYCVDISNQLLATQALLKSANQQILQAHIRSCVRDALQTDAVNPKLEEALKLLEKMIQ